MQSCCCACFCEGTVALLLHCDLTAAGGHACQALLAPAAASCQCQQAAIPAGLHAPSLCSEPCCSLSPVPCRSTKNSDLLILLSELQVRSGVSSACLR